MVRSVHTARYWRTQSGWCCRLKDREVQQATHRWSSGYLSKRSLKKWKGEKAWTYRRGRGAWCLNAPSIWCPGSSSGYTRDSVIRLGRSLRLSSIVRVSDRLRGRRTCPAVSTLWCGRSPASDLSRWCCWGTARWVPRGLSRWNQMQISLIDMHRWSNGRSWGPAFVDSLASQCWSPDRSRTGDGRCGSLGLQDCVYLTRRLPAVICLRSSYFAS